MLASQTSCGWQCRSGLKRRMPVWQTNDAQPVRSAHHSSSQYRAKHYNETEEEATKKLPEQNTVME